MTQVLHPNDKELAPLNMEEIEKAIKKANGSKNYPIMINIGNHIMNSATQNYLQELFIKAGYSVSREMERVAYRYEALYLDYYKPHKLLHTISNLKED